MWRGNRKAQLENAATLASAMQQGVGSPHRLASPRARDPKLERAGHSLSLFAGGERSRASAAVNRSTIAMVPPHCGQSHSGRDASFGVESVTVGGSTVCPSSAKHSGNNSARRRWAKNPKCRMRTKPVGSPCRKNRRKNSLRSSRISRFLFLCAESRQRNTTSRSEEHTSELQSPCNLVCRL